ncbi:hypothetical protein [Piscibacillus halophilus]|uniref:hypothetical protein n=1 Tax=Piscibacillus halophilus TaxID=571933 RepID=UPI002409AC29|nr:hypothetical protein [Piscibacillus halophilus]
MMDERDMNENIENQEEMDTHREENVDPWSSLLFGRRQPRRMPEQDHNPETNEDHE